MKFRMTPKTKKVIWVTFVALLLIILFIIITDTTQEGGSPGLAAGFFRTFLRSIL